MIIDISIYPGSDTTAQGLVSINGETLINSTNLVLPLAIGTSVGYIRVGKVSGSDTSFEIKACAVGSYTNLKLNVISGLMI